MQALILAAGMGNRLGSLTRDNTKCMVKVNGERLIERMLDQLSQLRLTKTVLVVGYKSDGLKSFVGENWKGMPIEYIENPDYSKTNNIYSLSLAVNELLADDTLLLESDLIFDEAILSRMVADDRPNLVCVDKYKWWMDGTMVVLDSGRHVKRFVSKRDFRYDECDRYYKTVNIYKFSRKFLESCYVPFLNAYSKVFGNNEYYEQVLKVISHIDASLLEAFVLDGEKWYEIDDAQDLNNAESLFGSAAMQIEKLHARFGGYWRRPDILDYCYLVNPYFPPEGLVREMKCMFRELLADYPSGMAVNGLVAAKNFGVPETMMVVGNGAAELIAALMRCLDGRLGLVRPVFDEYPNRLPAERVVAFMPTAGDFSYTADDLKAFAERERVDTLLVVNPDNPTGHFLAKKDLTELAEWTGGRGIRLIVDESFVDFADGSYTLIDEAVLTSNPHMCIIKSISKSYGVPGLRLGVLASGDDELVRRLRSEVSIWNINSFAEFFMQIFGRYAKDYTQACVLLREERARFAKALGEIPFLRLLPSQANFFMAEVKPPYTAQSLTTGLFEKAGVLIKNCSSKKGIDGEYVRIAVRGALDNDRLLDALSSM
jgi:histidinol-phosphate/aromatic aminotransferase/cobyric acid decarboxylase-like protein/GTP:adenosylcobinamide-phosphate guanylyltransferase